ncbi:MAG: hypothetical protein WCY67_03800 [Acidithiobacillus sp.]
MIFSPILAAQAAFLLIREIIKKWLPSFIGGYIFGFSSYELGQLLGHTNLTFTMAIPTILWLFILSEKNNWSAFKTTVFIGPLLAFQFYTSSEIYTTFFIFFVASYFIFYNIAVEY